MTLLLLAGLAASAPPALGPTMPVDLVIDALWDGSPAEPGEVVRVTLEDGGDDLLLHVDAPFHGDPPPDAPVGPTWRLWTHEVVEVFVTGIGAPTPYLEIELGPYGHHLVIQLEGQRNVLASCLPLEVEARIDGDRWTATARVPRSLLPLGADRLNAYAIHGPPDARRYLAWSPVPGDGPDFHRIALFPKVALP